MTSASAPTARAAALERISTHVPWKQSPHSPQLCPHAPQLSGSISICDSHPSLARPLQSVKPGSHASTHVPSTQLAAALIDAQTSPQDPHASTPPSVVSHAPSPSQSASGAAHRGPPSGAGGGGAAAPPPP